jgi:hypothetical protein
LKNSIEKASREFIDQITDVKETMKNFDKIFINDKAWLFNPEEIAKEIIELYRKEPIKWVSVDFNKIKNKEFFKAVEFNDKKQLL